MAKKKKLMEDENPKDFLDEEAMDGERVILLDERGQLLDEEEAMRQEEELLSKIDNFFLANPIVPNVASEEEEDEEETTVTINNEGDIVKEETKIVVATGELAVVSVNEPSIFEEQLVIRVIRRHMSELSKAWMEVDKIEGHLRYFVNGYALYDNIVDSYRKERNELSSLLNVRPVSLSNLKNEQLRNRLEMEYRETADKLFDLLLEFEE